MNDEQQVIDAETTDTAVDVREKSTQALAVMEHKHTDPAQARIEHVASLLNTAYAKASTLELTPDEIAKLTAEFSDADVCTGAGGDANLLYIQHISIRQRLAQVFGPCRWSLIPRRSWIDADNGFIYSDCVMLIRGCYVGEATGAARWTPKNARMNYSDAVESSQSEALRRIAGKYLGCGTQVWDKHYCEAWKARRNQPQQRPAQSAPTQQPAAVTKPSPTAGDDVPMESPKVGSPKPSEPAKKPTKATAETRKWMLEQLSVYPEAQVLSYARAKEIILPAVETLKDWPLDKVPTSKAALKELQSAIETFGKPTEAKAEKTPIDLTGKTSVRGLITNVEYKTGDTNGKKWVLFTITLRQGEQNDGKYTTFSRSLAEEAEEYAEKQTQVDLFYDGGEKGNTALAIVLPEVVP